MCFGVLNFTDAQGTTSPVGQFDAGTFRTTVTVPSAAPVGDGTLAAEQLIPAPFPLLCNHPLFGGETTASFTVTGLRSADPSARYAVQVARRGGARERTRSGAGMGTGRQLR